MENQNGMGKGVHDAFLQALTETVADKKGAEPHDDKSGQSAEVHEDHNAHRQEISLDLRNGYSLRAVVEDDPLYPAIAIYLSNGDNPKKSELICFAEYNFEKPAGHRICIGAYAAQVDEPAYYESYFPADEVC